VISNCTRCRLEIRVWRLEIVAREAGAEGNGGAAKAKPEAKAESKACANGAGVRRGVRHGGRSARGEGRDLARRGFGGPEGPPLRYALPRNGWSVEWGVEGVAGRGERADEYGWMVKRPTRLRPAIWLRRSFFVFRRLYYSMPWQEG
jgi:hypothetical protein